MDLEHSHNTFTREEMQTETPQRKKLVVRSLIRFATTGITLTLGNFKVSNYLFSTFDLS